MILCQALFDELGDECKTGNNEVDTDAFFKILNHGKKINVQVEDEGDVTFTINNHK